MRTVSNLPAIFTDKEWEEIKSKYYIHELGFMSNLSPNYYDTISVGLLEKRKTADDDGIEKVGMLVKNFIDRGGHQLQLNTINLDKMLGMVFSLEH